LKHGVDHWLF